MCTTWGGQYVQIYCLHTKWMNPLYEIWCTKFNTTHSIKFRTVLNFIPYNNLDSIKFHTVLNFVPYYNSDTHRCPKFNPVRNLVWAKYNLVRNLIWTKNNPVRNFIHFNGFVNTIYAGCMWRGEGFLLNNYVTLSFLYVKFRWLISHVQLSFQPLSVTYSVDWGIAGRHQGNVT